MWVHGVCVCVDAHRILSSSSARIERERKREGAGKSLGSRCDFYQVIDLGAGRQLSSNPLGRVLDGLGGAKFSAIASPDDQIRSQHVCVYVYPSVLSPCPCCCVFVWWNMPERQRYGRAGFAGGTTRTIRPVTIVRPFERLRDNRNSVL